MIRKIDLCFLPLLPYAIAVMLAHEVVGRVWDAYWGFWEDLHG